MQPSPAEQALFHSCMLILVLPDGAASHARYPHVRVSEGHAADTSSLANAQGLPPVRRGEEVVAIVPAHALSWHHVRLPRGVGLRSPRLRTVLNSLLEERLLDEPERLHIALGGQASAEGETWVAVCDRAWLREHVQALEAAGRAPDRIVPESAPLDATAQTRALVQVLGETDQPRLRVCRADGVIELPLSREAWALAVGSDPTDETLDVQAEPAVAALAEQMMQRRIRLQPRAARWAQAARSPWNLAQGEFAQHGGRGVLRRLAVAARGLLQSPLWQPLRWGVLALLLVQLAGLNLWAWRERADWRARQAAIDGVLTRHFPGVRVVVDAPAQMARELAQLRQATGASGREDLEPMLAALAASLEPGAALTALDYQAGELRVSGLATDDVALARLHAALHERGYSASRDEGRLRVKALSNSTSTPAP